MRKLIPATLLIATSQLLSRLLGVVRDHLFANFFGATGGVGIFDLDTYYAAFRLPDLVYNLLIFGVLSAAFVPLLAEKKNKEEVNEFASNVLNVLFVSILMLAGILFLFAAPFVKLITPGFDAEKIQLTAELLRIQLLAPIFFTLSAVFGGLAQHYHRFTWYSLAPLAYNAGIIGGTLLFARTFGVFGAAWGVAAGAALHALVQLPGIFRGGFRYRWNFEPRKLHELFRLSVPRVLSIGASQLQFITITYFASLVGAGALAVFNYAWNLASLPLGIVGIAYATTSFSRLAKLAHDTPKFLAKLRANLIGVWFWAVPASLGLFVLREDVVRLILNAGAFTEKDVGLVSLALAILMLSMPLMSLLPILNNAFFARKNTRVPMLGGVTFLIATWFFARTLTPLYHEAGPGIAYALANFVGIAVLLFFLRRKFKLQILKPFLKILVIGLLLGALVYALGIFWPARTFLALATKIGALSLLGGIFYLGAAKLFGLDHRRFEELPGVENL